MTVFKAFLKVFDKCKVVIIMYTVFLVIFGAFRMQTEEPSTSFVSSKPDVVILNEDEDVGLTKDFIDYMEEHSNQISVEKSEEALDDALFYRDVNYIIMIPKHFRKDFLNHQNPQIKVKSTGDYQASLAEMMVERYFKLTHVYQDVANDEEELVSMIEETLSKESPVELTSQLDSSGLERMSFYYNFMNYCLLAGCIYVIALILSSFREKGVFKRTVISSTNYQKHNFYLLLSNSLFGFVLWLFYVLLSFLLIGNSMFTLHGLFYILNSFVFCFCVLTIAFLLGNLVLDKNAINGIVNVIALGSSFLCGAFVPMEWLPEAVLKLAHVLPSYWYIQTNETLKNLEVFDKTSLQPIFVNMGVLLLFGVFFIILSNFVSRRRRKFD